LQLFYKKLENFFKREYNIFVTTYMQKNRYYFYMNNKKTLRTGFTTGSCAAAAAGAAAALLLGGAAHDKFLLTTPKGTKLLLSVEGQKLSDDRQSAQCFVQKDSGDDPDVTHGCFVYAFVSKKLPQTPMPAHTCTYSLYKNTDNNTCKSTPHIYIDGGDGVGRITKAGLDQPVGAAAINHVPRQMITEAVLKICNQYHFFGELYVEIRVPNGRALAEKTLNPRLGIIGGISILGTSGIVEPMSEQAFIDAIHVELRMCAAQSTEFLILTPGNYGMNFLQTELSKKNFSLPYQVDANHAVKCSNFIGDTLDFAVSCGFSHILLVGHIGKLIKLAAGIMNTHSRCADGRMEILTAHAALYGIDKKLAEQLMGCVSTDAALSLLKKAGILKTVMDSITKKILYYLQRRAGSDTKIDVICFCTEYGILGNSLLYRKNFPIE